MKNYWISSGLYSLLNQVTQMVFNLGSMLILYRVLDKPTCSVWVLFITITALIEVTRTGLLQNGLMTFLNTNPKSVHDSINTASFFLNVSFSVLFAILLWSTSKFIGNHFELPELTTLLNIYAFTTLLLSGVYQFNFIQQANLDFRGLFWSTLVRTSTLFFAILFLAINKLHVNLTTLACVQVIAALPAAFVAFLFARKYFALQRNIDWNWVKKLLKYGRFTFGTNAATMIFKSLDRFVIGSFTGLKSQVSTYDLSIKINNLAEVPTTTLAAILFPQSARKNHEEGNSAVKFLYEKSVGVLLSLIIPIIIFILVFADIIVTLLGSAAYSSAAPILRLTIFFGFFMAFAIQFGTVMDASGKPKLNFWITSMGAVVNLACNYLFITWFGVIGAAYGTLLAMATMFVIMQVILNRTFDIQIGNIFKYAFNFYGEAIMRLKGFKSGVNDAKSAESATVSSIG